MPGPVDVFEKRLQEWKGADAAVKRADEAFRRAMLEGAQGEDAERLQGELLKLRAHADSLITELLQDMARLSGRPRHTQG